MLPNGVRRGAVGVVGTETFNRMALNGSHPANVPPQPVLQSQEGGECGVMLRSSVVNPPPTSCPPKHLSGCPNMGWEVRS